MSIASRVNGLLPLLTFKLTDSTYLKWSFQIRTVLGSHGLFGYLDGSVVCPPQFVLDEYGVSTLEVNRAFLEWDQTDKALISLMMASVTEDSVEYILDCSSAHEAWLNVKERYSTDSRATIMQLKTDFQTLQKGADNIERFLLRIKHSRAQLSAVGVHVNDDDVYVVALNGLPDEFDAVKAVLRGHQGPMSMKEFRSQLLAAEQDINKKLTLAMVSNQSMAAMVAKLPTPHENQGPTGHNLNGNNHFHYGSTSASMDNGHSVFGNVYNGRNAYNDNNSMTAGGFHGYGHSGGYTNGGRGYNNNGYYNGGRWNGNGNGSYWNSNGGRNGKNWNSTAGRFNNNSGRGWSGNGGRQNNTWNNGWNGGRQAPECQICSKRGHTAVNCYDRDRTSQNHASSSVLECQICGKKGHVALDCFHRSNYAYQGSAPPQSLNAFTSQANVGFASEDVWIADTGATHHMTADLNNLTLAEPFNPGQNNSKGSVQRQE